jgi:hypothetical protein
MKKKHKFKVGDKIVISHWPLGMNSGNDTSLRTHYNNQTVFVIRSEPESALARNIQDHVMCVYVDFANGDRFGWYFDLASIALVKGYKAPKKIKSWSL